MKCTAIGCKCTATNKAMKLWGDNSSIGFCNEHSPEWLKNLAIGDLSPKTNMLGVTKSWYKKIN